jgi:hypothetical protein
VPDAQGDASADGTTTLSGFAVESRDGGYEHDLYLPGTTIVVYAEDATIAQQAVEALASLPQAAVGNRPGFLCTSHGPDVQFRAR